ncbi:MAG: beta-ketoacyl-ACP synthase 3 [Pseudobutyrivibrio sp.]|nr:beta-ketoacyl-ACP synthase 3 [Pseudobutyrivibrio sp.]
MDKALKIVSTGRALPSHIMSNMELELIVDTSDQWIRERTGIESRRICTDDENATTLAVEAGRKAIEEAQKRDTDFDIDKIAALIVATSSGEYYVPSIACQVQKALDLPQEIMAFDLAAACTGYVFGLKTAAALLDSFDESYALVIGTECLSSITDYTDRTTCILFGDGAGASIVSLTNSDTPFWAKTWSDGNTKALTAIHGGKIAMEGQEIFRFATTVITKTINTMLDKANITMDDIDYIVCHQANARIIDYVKRKFKGYEDKFFMNVATMGNTSAASIPMAIAQMDEEGMLKPGMKLLCVGFGGGLTWGGALVLI